MKSNTFNKKVKVDAMAKLINWFSKRTQCVRKSFHGRFFFFFFSGNRDIFLDFPTLAPSTDIFKLLSEAKCLTQSVRI